MGSGKLTLENCPGANHGQGGPGLKKKTLLRGMGDLLRSGMVGQAVDVG